MPTFTVPGPGGTAVTHRATGEVIQLGRAPNNDVVVDDPQVSRRHAEVRGSGEIWVLHDLGSRHGTLLNGTGVKRPMPLKAGDEIGLGRVQLRFGLEVGEQAAQARQRSTGAAPAASDSGAVFVGKSAAARAVLALVGRLAPADATVLVSGESGTGKEVVARLLHERSARSAGPFVIVNCPALPGSLLEGELFGVERRVATGVDPRPGKLELGAGGTLFLDEIGDMDLSAQAKLLRFLQDKTVERIGGRKPMTLDVRVVAATNHDLAADVERGSFRRDLYYRLALVAVVLPALRERREDIPLLIEHFLRRAGSSLEVSSEALGRLASASFPGNVRELERLVERARLLAEGALLEAHDFFPSRDESTPAARGLYERIVEDGESFWTVVHEPYLRRRLPAEAVSALIQRAYQEAGGSNRRMAERFGLVDLPSYRRLTAFLRHHGFLIRKKGAPPGA